MDWIASDDNSDREQEQAAPAFNLAMSIARPYKHPDSLMVPRRECLAIMGAQPETEKTTRQVSLFGPRRWFLDFVATPATYQDLPDEMRRMVWDSYFQPNKHHPAFLFQLSFRHRDHNLAVTLGPDAAPEWNRGAYKLARGHLITKALLIHRSTHEYVHRNFTPLPHFTQTGGIPAPDEPSQFWIDAANDIFTLNTPAVPHPRMRFDHGAVGVLKPWLLPMPLPLQPPNSSFLTFVRHVAVCESTFANKQGRETLSQLLSLPYLEKVWIFVSWEMTRNHELNKKPQKLFSTKGTACATFNRRYAQVRGMSTASAPPAAAGHASPDPIASALDLIDMFSTSHSAEQGADTGGGGGENADAGIEDRMGFPEIVELHEIVERMNTESSNVFTAMRTELAKVWEPFAAKGVQKLVLVREDWWRWM
ncbi:Uu.00g142820.m01.CDS01 [Anthostomella pinea]|uniref:Uu.00g142820.m01.CDS01 n=1 Tax=Anthostomella pinea TaxID=933095 RepID=A0AAI8YJ76_9PEZI|nr:Uu.00g142820.m01.CDS01 [Anthostomella pinea]